MLSFPSLRQVGHCKVPASFGHSSPMQAFLIGTSAAMLALVQSMKRNIPVRQQVERGSWREVCLGDKARG